jgi:hypothetical protein
MACNEPSSVTDITIQIFIARCHLLKKRPVPEITELVCHSDITLGCLHEHALLLQTQSVKQRGPTQYRTVVYIPKAPHNLLKVPHSYSIHNRYDGSLCSLSEMIANLQ